MSEKNWIVKLKENISREKENFSEKDYKYFHIDRLIKVSEHLDKYSSSCRECLKMKEPIFDLSENLSQHINGKVSDRAHFENIFDEAVTHLKRFHNLYPPFYFNYLYTFFGFAAGMLFGSLVYFLLPDNPVPKLILIMALVGMFIGQVIGRKKDNKVRNKGRKL